MNSKSNKLDIEDKLIELYQLKSIIRYNNKQKLTSESVAEHSFYVALMGMMISDELLLKPKYRQLVIIKALLHDMPEVEINDITYDVKTRLHLQEFLAKYEEDYYQRNFPIYADLMKKHSDGIFHLIDLIVDLADALSVKQFSSNEMQLGNRSEIMTGIFNESESRIEQIKQKLYEEKEKHAEYFERV